MKFFCHNLPHPSGRLGQGSSILGHHPFVLEMIYIDDYCTGFMILWGYGVNNNTIYNSVSKDFQFFLSFQNITLVC